jgi:hypothetical protein
VFSVSSILFGGGNCKQHFVYSGFFTGFFAFSLLQRFVAQQNPEIFLTDFLECVD